MSNDAYGPMWTMPAALLKWANGDDVLEITDKLMRAAKAILRFAIGAAGLTVIFWCLQEIVESVTGELILTDGSSGVLRTLVVHH